MGVHFVVAQCLFEFGPARVGVDQDKFAAGHVRVIFEAFGRDRIAVAGVVGSAGENPRGAGGLEIGPACPDRAGDGEAARKRRGFDGVDLIDDEDGNGCPDR
jgi:hypothetical protein